MEKKCTKCGEVKPLSEFKKYYYKGKPFLRNTCKACVNKMERARYWKDDNIKIQAKLRKREWNKKHPEKARETSRKWRNNNRDKANALSVEWVKKNPDKQTFMQARLRNNLSDGYVKQQIKRQTGIPTANIPDDIIELKRLQIKLNRKIKQKKSEL